MSVSIANVNPAINSFQNWLDKTNQALDVISTKAMTADLTINGSNTSGNAVLIGIFTSNVVTVANTLRGGTMTTPGNLTITTNTTIVDTGSFFVNNTNIRVLNSNTFINATAFYVAGGTANITSNVSVSSETIFLGSANLTVTSDTDYFVSQANNISFAGTNTYITANVTIGGTNTVISSNTFFYGTVNFDGGLTVVGTTTLRGDVKLGNTSANTISMIGSVNTAIIPDQDGSRDLGSSPKQWRKLYVQEINASQVNYSGDLASVNAISTNTLTVGTQSKYVAFSNADIGNANTAGVFDVVPFFTISKTEARTLKLVVEARNTSLNTWSSSEMLLVHDGTTPYMTVYATLSTNTAAPAFVYTTDISGSDIRFLIQQPAGGPNTSIKGFAHIVKA